MSLYKLLSVKKFRDELELYLNENLPELIECDPNNHIHDWIKIFEYNNPEGGLTNHSWFDGRGLVHDGPVHHFSLAISDKANKSMSCQMLWYIGDYSTLDDIDKIAKNNEWGYKIREGWKYPNIGEKTKGVILSFIREYKLEKIFNQSS